MKLLLDFSVSCSWKFLFGSDIHSRFRNVMTIIDSFSVKEFNVSVKTSENILNSMDFFTKSYTSSPPHLSCFHMCVDGIMKNVSSFSVIVTTDSKSEFASPIF